MAPEGEREELVVVVTGEEGKPPRSQSILVSGNWRELGGGVRERHRRMVRKKRDGGMQEINRGCRDAR